MPVVLRQVRRHHEGVPGLPEGPRRTVGRAGLDLGGGRLLRAGLLGEGLQILP